MAAEQCSECGARPGTEGTPACECRGGTSASSDSFAPQRVRPYFAPSGDEAHAPGTAPLGRLPAIRTMTVHPVRYRMRHDAGPSAHDVELFARTPAGDTPEDRPPPQDADAHTHELPPVHLTPAPQGGPGFRAAQRRSRAAAGRRRSGAIVAAVAALGIGAAAFAGTLFSDRADHDNARPEPEQVIPTAPAETEASPDPSSRATRSTSASPSRTKATVKASPLTTSAKAESSDTRPSPTDTSARQGTPTLRKGDSGPEVVELQQRLSQLNLLDTSQLDGEYDRELVAKVRNYQRSRGIEGDPAGVYGPATRRSLEAETSEP